MNDNLSRRQLLLAGSCGFGHLAFSGLATQQAMARQSTEIDKNHPLAQRKPHFAARAKRVIFMFMQGGPTHVDTFDHKPELKKQHGKQVNFSFDGKKFAGRLMESPFRSPSSSNMQCELRSESRSFVSSIGLIVSVIAAS